MTKRDKGGWGEAEAIRFYTILGYTVCIPFTPTTYDLLIEKNGKYQRIQCKYVGRFKNYAYELNLTTRKRNGDRIKIAGFDELFVLTSDGKRYRIPVSETEGKKSIKINNRFFFDDSFVPVSPQEEGKCKRCGKSYNGPYIVCDACRKETAERQRVYRKNQKS